jgi:carboxyl-terminal processing protease
MMEVQQNGPDNGNVTAQGTEMGNQELSPKRRTSKLQKAGLVLLGMILGAAAAAIGIYAAGGGLLSSAAKVKLLSLQKLIEKHYYQADSVTDDQLAEGMYEGLINALDDPYSVYYSADDVAALEESISGTYVGIGAYVSKDETTNCPKISGVIENSPAEEAGLMADDILLKADGESLQDLDLDVAVSKIRGEKGTTVQLTIARGSEELEISVTRDEVASVTVAGEMLEDGIGYLQIAEFDTVTSDQFIEKLQELQEQDMKGLILDLRGNPGGTVDAVTTIAKYLIPEGLIFYMQYPDGSTTEYDTDGSLYQNLLVVVLVNGNSASASEILSSAIQDSGAGTVIGTQTYGKGVVQTLYSLGDGSAVRLTVAEYFTRNGNSIHKIGVTPDEVVELDTDAYLADGSDNQLDAALEAIRKTAAEQ